jgi:mono/diheme cytochrome c family protein
VRSARVGWPRVARFLLSAAALAALSCFFESAFAADTPGAVVERGRYLADAGDCVSCHTRVGGAPFSGGLAFSTPFGIIHSTNITPDPQSGIGRWTQTDFERALRQGVGHEGEHLYPVFPYPSFTKTSDADVAALWAFLRSIPPVKYTTPANDVTFPFGQRWLLGVWKRLYFKEGRFVADESKSAEWNRGAYLVEGLGHCGACHSPRNFLGAEDTARAMTGGALKEDTGGRSMAWSAVNLTSSSSGLQSWSMEDLTNYLKLGYSPHASVFGPMNSVVMNSTRRLTPADDQAIAAYLKSLAAKKQDSGTPSGNQIMADGETLYSIHCGTCHLPTGLGSISTGPPLAGSAVVLAADPKSLINVTLGGPELPSPAPSEEWQSRKWQAMPAFSDKLSDDEIAALLSYIRNSWGNKEGAVSADQVSKQR